MKDKDKFIPLGIMLGLLALALPALADNDPKAQMLLGNPDNATNSQSNPEHYLLKRGQFALSYNDKLHFPNWVAWHLNKKDIGSTERGKFVSDPDLPNSFAHIVTGDYNKSGYDRGHNCPSKDRSATRKDNDVAFYMSNITPQQHGMNAGPWELLESYSRQLTLAGNELYILCGHGFSAKTHKNIGRSAIAVPDSGWKIIVVIPVGCAPQGGCRHAQEQGGLRPECSQQGQESGWCRASGAPSAPEVHQEHEWAGMGEHQEQSVLACRLALLRQDNGGQVHE